MLGLSQSLVKTVTKTDTVTVYTSGITKAVGNASLPERPVKRAPAGRVEHAGDTSNLIPEEGYLLLSFDQKRVGFIPNITSLSKKEAVFVTFL